MGIFPPRGLIYNPKLIANIYSLPQDKTNPYILFQVIFSLKHFFLEDLFKTKSNDLIMYKPSLDLVSLIAPGGPTYQG